MARRHDHDSRYATASSDLDAIAALTPSNDDFIQRKSGVWVNRSIAQVVADLGILAGAPNGADYLVGTAQAGLSAEIVVGTTPGGELGGTWASPTVDATHSGSAHHAQSHDHSAAGDGTALHPASAAFGATPASGGRIRLTQGASEGIWGRNAADSGDVGLLAINGSDESELRAPARFHANAWNHIRATGAATGNDPVIEAIGNDTDVDLDLRPQGAGLLRYSGTEISKVGHSHAIDFGEAGDITAEAFGDTASAGASGEVADAAHRHAMPANPVTAHEAAGDPHTGYRLESADHTHASSGLQGGQIAYSSLTGTPAAERAAASTTPAAIGTAAVGVGTTDARADHVHATGAGTPSTQAFGDAAATGSGPAAAMTDHKHAMPANPVVAHEAASDPHTGYRLESADHTHATTGLQAGTIAHSVLTGLTATDHHAAPAAGPDADVTVDAAGAAGTAATFARSGHGHKLATSASAPAAIGTAAAGTSGHAPSRDDHVHATGAGTPSTQAFGDAAATGTGPAAAMTDHKHAFPALGTTPSTQAFADAAAGGSATTPSKNDHKHAMPTLGYGLAGNSAPAVGLTTASALATAATSVSAATYADVTGASISLAAGTWLIIADVYGSAANLAFLMHAAITDGANAIVREGSAFVAASGTASVNAWGHVGLHAIVSPGSTTTYKIRAARGLTTLTNTWTAQDGAGTNVANNASSNTDKGTGILAIRIA